MARKAEAATKSGQAEPELEGLSFEQLLERLSEVVESLEAGDAPLEEALATFERGVKLSRLGGQRLDEAEQRVELLLRDGRTEVLPMRPAESQAESQTDEEDDD